jgi:hypothetical protein
MFTGICCDSDVMYTGTLDYGVAGDGEQYTLEEVLHIVSTSSKSALETGDVSSFLSDSSLGPVFGLECCEECAGGVCSIGCDSDEDCNDQDSCTLDYCDTETETCQNSPIAGCTSEGCTSDADCEDGDTCTEDKCTDGECSNPEITDCTPTACTSDSDCEDDGLECTVEYCYIEDEDERGECKSSTIAGQREFCGREGSDYEDVCICCSSDEGPLINEYGQAVECCATPVTGTEDYGFVSYTEPVSGQAEIDLMLSNGYEMGDYFETVCCTDCVGDTCDTAIVDEGGDEVYIEGQAVLKKKCAKKCGDSCCFEGGVCLQKGNNGVCCDPKVSKPTSTIGVYYCDYSSKCTKDQQVCGVICCDKDEKCVKQSIAMGMASIPSCVPKAGCKAGGKTNCVNPGGWVGSDVVVDCCEAPETCVKNPDRDVYSCAVAPKDGKKCPKGTVYCQGKDDDTDFSYIGICCPDAGGVAASCHWQPNGYPRCAAEFVVV